MLFESRIGHEHEINKSAIFSSPQEYFMASRISISISI
jgi:hypothetical protein